MKKFLSFLLAVLMIVSVMLPMLTLLVSAEGSSDEKSVIESDYPDLVITEFHPNAVYVSNIYSTLMNGSYATAESKKLASTMFTQGCGEFNYVPVYAGAGSVVTGLYIKNVDAATGTVSFDKVYGIASTGVQYYRLYDYTANDNECLEFIELYNSGSERINLYDYKIAFDNDAFKLGDEIRYIDLYGGPSESASHGQYFTKAGNITEFEEGITYYTKSNQSTYVPVAPGEAFSSNKTYYYEVPEGSFVNNPSEEEGAWLEPGQVAVLWNYTYRAWKYQLTEELFKAYFTYAYGFNQNWDDVLFLAMDGNGSDTDRYLPKSKNATVGDLGESGPVAIGIVKDGVTDKTGVTREEEWTSWVLHTYYMGINYTASFALQSKIVGYDFVVDPEYFIYDEENEKYVPVSEAKGAANSDGTAKKDVEYFALKNGSYVLQKLKVDSDIVLDPKLFVYDQRTGEYVPASKEGGTADRNGKAMPGVNYYKPSANASGNGSNSRSVNFIYGLDASAKIKQGIAYTLNTGGISPGLLGDVQAAVLPNYNEKKVDALGKTPNIVITEVVPDNGPKDAYEYVEVVNTSGAPLNIFDYSFVAHPNSFQTYQDQFFNKVMPLIPGEYGSILASSGITKYEETYADLAPTNVSYQSGWLQPGEAALLWAFTADSYAEQATFAKFRSHYAIGENVKVFAMDGDGTLTTGRAQRQDLQDTGFSMYGMIANSKMVWANNMYTSNPVFQTMIYAAGNQTVHAYRGIPISECESFVICGPLYVNFCTDSIGTDYGYQYVWGNINGATNKCGSFLRMSYSTSNKAQDFSGTGSVITSAWKASPGRLLAEQKTDMLSKATTDRYVVYMQDFNGYGTVSGYASVAEKLGLSGVSANAALNDAHNANVAATEGRGTSFLELRDGKLYVNNRGENDDYMTLMSDKVLSLLDDQSFTIEYAMTYDADLSIGRNGYSGVLYNFDAANMTYGAPIVRVSGYGNNAIVRGNNWIDIDGGEGNETSLANKSLGGVPTLYERLYGNSGLGELTTLDGAIMLAGKTITVRVDVDRSSGVTVTVNDVVVSCAQLLPDSDTSVQWDQFVEEAISSNLVLATSSNIAVAYDYITVYTDGSAMRGTSEELYGNGFVITEFHQENSDFKAMEITNVADIPMNVYDCMIVTTKGKTGELLNTWDHAIKFFPGVPVSSYDPQYKNLKHISNPANGMIQPGESVVIWIMSDAKSYADGNGKVSISTDDFRDYYKGLGCESLTDSVKVIVAYDQKTDVKYLAYGLAKMTNVYYTESDRSFFANIFHQIEPQNDTTYSLGLVRDDQVSLVAPLSFTHIGEIVNTNDEGDIEVINVHCHQSMLNGLTAATVENTSASVSTSGTGAKISFKAGINAAFYNRAVEMFGQDNISYGILVVRADAVTGVKEIRPYLLDMAGVSYVNDNNKLRSTSSGKLRSIYGNAQTVEAGYYTVSYSAVAYMTIETQAFGTITKYADTPLTQSAKQIAATAMMQYVNAETAKAEMAANPGVKYYEISKNKWSLYTREQIDRLNVLCK